MTRRGFLALAASVREDSLGRLAERMLPAGVEYLLLRTRDSSPLVTRWANVGSPAPLGSLVKPFLTLAYGEVHGFRYPELDCAACWRPQGHGTIGITAALAQSCNSYFLQLARFSALPEIERVAARYGLPVPHQTSAESLIGRYGDWRAKPFTTAWAYGELVQRRTEPGVTLVLDAMRQCARIGTASGIGAGIAAKTGTAPCVHARRSGGDGLVVAILPEFVLLARAHAMPGAECARRVGPFVRAVLR